jgi:hypothetical protein
VGLLLRDAVRRHWRRVDAVRRPRYEWSSVMYHKSPMSFGLGCRRSAPRAAVALVAALTMGLPSLALAKASASPVMSEAQLKQSLEAQGYRNVRLTSLEPEVLFPQPQRVEPQSAATLESEAAHTGWNGTADGDGLTFDIYVSPSGQVLAR